MRPDHLIPLVAAIALVVLGWWVRGLHESKLDLVQVTAAAEEREAFLKKEARVAAVVEQKLAGLRANERVIERERTKIVDRPVYRVDCIDDAGLRFLERRAAGAPAEPAGAVPAAAPSAGG